LTRTPVRNDLWHDHCPLCGHADTAGMGKVPLLEDTVYSTHAVELEKVPEIWKCRNCASWFTQNAVPEATARSLYATGNSGSRWVAEPFEAAKSPELIRELDRHIGAGKTVLDIGCSTGELLDFAKGRGALTSGMDFSESCRPTVTGKGHRFGTSLADFSNERFDVVTAFDVIEHLYDFPGFMESMANLLKPGGKFIVLTGDISSLGARYCGSRWWYLRYPEHIVFPSRRVFDLHASVMYLERTVRTYASVGYRVSFLPALRASISLGVSGRYDGLPSLGPDHMLLTLSLPRKSEQ
jgi:SAM-dependent methyltransferase